MDVGTDPENTSQLAIMAQLLQGKQPQEYTTAEQRHIFSQIQANPTAESGVTVSEETVGDIKLYIYRPAGVTKCPFIYYIHGGGFMFGGAADWAGFVHELVQKTQIAIVLPEYTLAPDKQFPAQHEQCINGLGHVVKNADALMLIPTVVVASDSVASQIGVSMAILNDQRSLGINIVHQVLFHPSLDTTQELSDAPLANREWLEQQVDAYYATPADRDTLLGSPGRMTSEQAKQYMPPTTVVTAEIDGFRPHGETFAKFLQKAGVSCGVVCAIGTMHNFEIFNEARKSPTARMVMHMVAGVVRDALELS